MRLEWWTKRRHWLLLTAEDAHPSSDEMVSNVAAVVDVATVDDYESDNPDGYMPEDRFGFH